MKFLLVWGDGSAPYHHLVCNSEVYLKRAMVELWGICSLEEIDKTLEFTAENSNCASFRPHGLRFDFATIYKVSSTDPFKR
jgi:hypothetical protein